MNNLRLLLLYSLLLYIKKFTLACLQGQAENLSIIKWIKFIVPICVDKYSLKHCNHLKNTDDKVIAKSDKLKIFF